MYLLDSIYEYLSNYSRIKQVDLLGLITIDEVPSMSY